MSTRRIVPRPRPPQAPSAILVRPVRSSAGVRSVALLTARRTLATYGASAIDGGKVELAQKVTVVLEDDLTGGPAGQTVRFAFDGTGYEIDLNAKNGAALRKQLAPYLEHARRAGRGQPRRPGRTAASRQRSGDIRAWATEHGVAVSERGRIPASVVDQYNAVGER